MKTAISWEAALPKPAEGLELSVSDAFCFDPVGPYDPTTGTIPVVWAKTETLTEGTEYPEDEVKHLQITDEGVIEGKYHCWTLELAQEGI